jgi:hypothetical protein
MVVKPADDGGASPVSPYDYHDLSLQDLRNVLSLSSAAITNVQNSWLSLATNLTNNVIKPLELAIASLDTWQSAQASKPFKDRANEILAFGKQIVNAAHQEGENFNDLSRTFHTSAWFLGISINDMNTLHNLAESALQEWSRDLYVLVGYLSRQTTGAQSGGSDTIGNFSGYASWQALPNQPVINFQYLYGHGQSGSYPGFVQFSGTVHPQTSRVDITAQAGPYPAKTLTGLIMYDDWSDGDWAARTFPDTHRDQLAALLNQVAGSSYTPLVRQFPQLPSAPWLKGSQNSNDPGGPGSGPGYTGGSAGSLPTGSGSTGLPGLGGTKGSVGSPAGTGTGTGLPGLPGSGSIGSPSGSAGNPFGGPGSGHVGDPTQLAGYTPPSAGSGSLGSLGTPTSGFGSGNIGSPGGLGGGSLGSLGGVGGAGSLGSAGSLAGGGFGTASGAAGGLDAGGAVAGETASGLAATTGRSSMPMMPPMMPPQAGNQDRDRQRKSWLPEDEDIWGTDAGGVPPVISGDA